MATITVYMKDGQASDDAANLGTIGFPYDEDDEFYTLFAGLAPAKVGIRFQGLNIPQGSTINSATLYFFGFKAADGYGSFDIWGVDVDDAPTWADTTNEPENATKTTAIINFYIRGAYPLQQFHIIISAIVQEIINREGWSSGNDLALVTQHNSWEGRNDAMYINTFEFLVGGPNENKYRLVIDFTPPATGTNTKINIGDNFKDIDSMKINIGDAWKDVAEVKQNIGNAWKVVF